jgi:hypothetical protein
MRKLQNNFVLYFVALSMVGAYPTFLLIYSAVTRRKGETTCSSGVTGVMFSEDYKLAWKKYHIPNC